MREYVSDMTPSSAGGRLAWKWSRFGDLTGAELYEMLALRQRVFVVEQNCVFQDADGRDPDAWHLLGREDAAPPRKLIAYARVFEAGVRYAEMSIGRIVSAPEARGNGVGRLILAEALRFCTERWRGRPIRIAAQRRLEKFYADFGFVADGEPYLEDGIEHLDMIKTAT